MNEKSLAQLGQELAELVRRHEATSAQILSHPVFSEMPNSVGVEKVLEEVAESLRADLQRSTKSLDIELEKLRQALQTMDDRLEQVPSGQVMN